MGKFFKILHRSSKSKARLGEIHTAQGIVKTPAFVPVATKGTLKSLTPLQIADLHLQLAFVNTYHLVTHPGVDVLERAGGIHQFSKLNIPLMSDSGGFQVFSLAQSKRQPQRRAHIRDAEEQPLVEKISEDGVIFRSTYDGSLIEFTPEKSMEYQQKIGADLVMAFDECTYYPATHEYTEKAMKRTHEWLKRCIKYLGDHTSSTVHRPQYLYGIIQGGTFEDLRKQSAQFIATQDTAGVAIGGVSVGESKEEMRQQVGWISDYLPHDKPVHLLGVGHIDDILDLVNHGIDTFDCVEPTRLARMGTIYQSSNKIDILKTQFKEDMLPLDENCACWVCQNFSKAYIHHLFKQKELLGYTLASYHNLFFMEKLMEHIRNLISEDKI